MEKDGKLSSLLERLKDCNISHFKKNFIIAGPKTNVLAIYNALKSYILYIHFSTKPIKTQYIVFFKTKRLTNKKYCDIIRITKEY